MEPKTPTHFPPLPPPLFLSIPTLLTLPHLTLPAHSTFVNSRPLPVIMADMRERIARNDPEQERRDAIQAMVEIAIDRAGKMGG